VGQPTDLVKQSIPLSYLHVSVASTDGATHSIQVYSDISGEWVSGASEWDIQWSTTTTDILSHQISLVSPAKYEEISDQSQCTCSHNVSPRLTHYQSDGNWYYSILNGKGASAQIGRDAVVRAQFLNNGVLSTVKDNNFRAIADSWPVFALEKVGSTGGST
jgi:hypothetical protein